MSNILPSPENKSNVAAPQETPVHRDAVDTIDDVIDDHEHTVFDASDLATSRSD